MFDNLLHVAIDSLQFAAEDSRSTPKNGSTLLASFSCVTVRCNSGID